MITSSKEENCDDKCVIKTRYVGAVKIVEVEYCEPIDQIAIEFERTRSTQARKAYVREAVRLNRLYGRIYKETI